VDAKAAVDAKILFGWPVESTDKLVDLSRQAHADAISIADWRSRDRELRAHLPPLSDDDTKSVDDLKSEIIRACAYESEDSNRLLGRLGAMIRPAPDNAELRKQLAMLTDWLREFDGEGQTAIGKQRERIVRWLREEDDDDRDTLTMLPWSLIARFRIIDDPDLGPVPKTIMAARKRALNQATEDQVTEARSMGGEGVDTLSTALSAALQSMYTHFPKLLIHADPDEPGAAELAQSMRDLWNNPTTQRILRRETANGWPPEYE